MSACRENRARILAAAEGALPLEQQLVLEEHLGACPRCRALHARESGLQEAFARLPEPPFERLDVERCIDRIGARIARAAPDAGPTRPPAAAHRVRLAWIVGSLAAAAGLALILANLRDAALPRGASDVASTVPAPLAQSPDPEPRAPEPAPLAPDREPAPAPIDAARLAAVREEVRGALIAALPELPREGTAGTADSFVARVDERLRDRGAAGWPIVRLVEGFAADVEPHDLAVAALRWLGARGDRLSIHVLRGALASPERKRAAASALADSGPSGREALAATVLDPELFPLALSAFLRAPVAERLRLLEAGLRSAARNPLDPAGAELAFTLAAQGDAGIARLVALDAEGVVRQSVAANALAGTLSIRERLLAVIGPPPGTLPVDATLRAIAGLRPAGCIAWLEEAAIALVRRGDTAGAETALRGLAGMPEADALQALLRLERTARLPRRSVSAAIAAHIERHPAGAVTLARRLAAEGPAVQLRALRDWVLEQGTTASAPALVELARSAQLSGTDRRYALLQAAEVGAPDLAPRVATLFVELPAADNGLRATCLVALHRLAGSPAVSAALEPTPAPLRERALAVLEAREARGTPITTSQRLARALEPVLAHADP